LISLWPNFDEDQNEDNDQESSRYVDPKAPPPTCAIRQGPSNDGSSTNANTERTDDDALVLRDLFKFDCVANDGKSSLEKACGPEAKHRATKYQDGGIWSSCADDRANLKGEDRCEVDRLGDEILVEVAEERLERGDGEQVGGSVPRDVVKRVEFGGDFGHCNTNDIGI